MMCNVKGLRYNHVTFDLLPILYHISTVHIGALGFEIGTRVNLMYTY